ncbi:uncharacterized protein [Dysidea avara]|uniref:uncharacterized protein isoform X1 n=4 Tax=Dysidea avara TaxID=196820 RepID=UPI003328FC1A
MICLNPDSNRFDVTRWIYQQLQAKMVDPSVVFLKDSIDESMYFPSENGTFNLSQEGVMPFSTLLVEGRNLTEGRTRTPTGTPSSHVQSLNSSNSSIPGTNPPVHVLASSTPYQGSSNSMFRSVVARRPPPSSTVKLVQAKLTKNGRTIRFHDKAQIFVNITESTAHTEFILAAIQQKWGSDHVIVTNNGLKIENSSATQGLAFWKAPRRKLYAMTQRDLNMIQDDADDDIDEELAPRAAKRIKNELRDMRDEFRGLRSIIERTLPISLRDKLKDILKCCICQVVPIRPPMVISMCCKSIVGCEQCVQQLLATSHSANCPLCRDTDFETVKVLGLDGLITAVSSYLEDETDTAGDES